MDAVGEPVNWSRYIINLAYEGVPQRAIARALQLPPMRLRKLLLAQWPAALSSGRPAPSGRKGRMHPGIRSLPDPRSMKRSC